jgi:hypothetical protein
MFVRVLVYMFVYMYTINSLTPKTITTKFGVLTIQNTTKKVRHKEFWFNNTFSY